MIARFDRWTFDSEQRLVTGEGHRRVHLTPKEFDLLTHARIIIGDSGAFLEDLGSKNGTRLGETACVGRVALRDGDTIRLGPVSMIFRASSGGMSTVTAIAGDTA